MHPGGRYVGRVDTNADLHTVLEYAMCRAFLGSRCNTAAEPFSVRGYRSTHCVGIRNVQGFSQVKVHHPGRAILHTHPHRQGRQEHSSWDNSHCQGSVLDAELQLCWDTQLQGFSRVKVQHPGQAIHSLNFGTTGDQGSRGWETAVPIPEGAV